VDFSAEGYTSAAVIPAAAAQKCGEPYVFLKGQLILEHLCGSPYPKGTFVALQPVTPRTFWDIKEILVYQPNTFVGENLTIDFKGPNFVFLSSYFVFVG